MLEGDAYCIVSWDNRSELKRSPHPLNKALFCHKILEGNIFQIWWGVENPTNVILHSDNFREFSFGYTTFPLTFFRGRWQGKRVAAAKTTLVTRDWRSFWVWEGSSTSSFSPLYPWSALSGPGTSYNWPSPSGMDSTGAHFRLKLRQSKPKLYEISS